MYPVLLHFLLERKGLSGLGERRWEGHYLRVVGWRAGNCGKLDIGRCWGDGIFRLFCQSREQRPPLEALKMKVDVHDPPEIGYS